MRVRLARIAELIEAVGLPNVRPAAAIPVILLALLPAGGPQTGQVPVNASIAAETPCRFTSFEEQSAFASIPGMNPRLRRTAGPLNASVFNT